MKKTTKRNKTKYFIYYAVASILIAFTLGYFLGDGNFGWAYLQHPASDEQDEKLVTKEEFEIFWEAWNKIDEHYPFKEPGKQDKIFGAIAGIAESYEDPHIIFLPPEDSEYFLENVSGEFFGIGAEIGKKDGNITVVAPLKDSPAEQAGLQSGDIIMKVDGEKSTGTTIDVVQQIRGEEGRDVELTVFRPGDSIGEHTITITRQRIEIPNVDTEFFEAEKVFVISLYSFSAHSAKNIYESLGEFIDSGAESLILDLRNNAGGFLQQANLISGFFLPRGELIVREDFGEGVPEKQYRSKENQPLISGLNKENFVILTNGGSASASEILAGAMQDHEVATIVGTKTFGKGSVQEMVRLSNGGSINVTVARWLTPERQDIDKNGLEPDILVSAQDLREHRESGEESDLILERAKEFLVEQE